MPLWNLIRSLPKFRPRIRLPRVKVPRFKPIFRIRGGTQSLFGRIAKRGQFRYKKLGKATTKGYKRQGYQTLLNSAAQTITPAATQYGSIVQNAPIEETPYTGLTTSRLNIRQRFNKSWENVKGTWENIRQNRVPYQRFNEDGDIELAEFRGAYDKGKYSTKPTGEYKKWLKETKQNRRLGEVAKLQGGEPDWSNPTRIDNPEWVKNLYHTQIQGTEEFETHIPGLAKTDDNVMWNFDENEKKWFFIQNMDEAVQKVENVRIRQEEGMQYTDLGTTHRPVQIRRYGTPSHEYMDRHKYIFNYKGALDPAEKPTVIGEKIAEIGAKAKKINWSKEAEELAKKVEKGQIPSGIGTKTDIENPNAEKNLIGEGVKTAVTNVAQIQTRINNMKQTIKKLEKQIRDHGKKTTDQGLVVTPHNVDPQITDQDMADNTQQGTASGTNATSHGATAQNIPLGAGANVNAAANRPFQNEDHQRFEKITRTYSRSYIVTLPIYTENTCEYFCNAGKKEVKNDGTATWKTIDDWSDETDASMGAKPKNYKPNNDDVVKIEWASPLSYIPYNRCAASMTTADMREFENLALKYRVLNYGFEMTGFQGHFEAPGVRPAQPRQGIPQNFQLLLNLDQDNSLTPLNISNSMEALDLDATWYKAQRKNIWDRGTHNNAFSDAMPVNPQETILPRLIIGGEFPQKWLVENTQSDGERIDWTKTTRTNMNPNVLYDIYNDHESNVVVPDVDVAYIHENPSQQWILNGPMYEKAGWRQKHEYPIPLRKQTWEKLSPKYAPIQTEIHSDWDTTRQRTQVRTQDVHTTTNLAYQFPQFAPICSLMVYPMYTAMSGTMTHTTGFVQARLTYRAQVEMLVQNRIPLFPHFNPKMQWWTMFNHKSRPMFETHNDKATEDDRQQSMQSKFIPGDWPDQPSIKPTIFQADRHISVDLPGMNPAQAASATFVKPDPTYVSVIMDNED